MDTENFASILPRYESYISEVLFKMPASNENGKFDTLERAHVKIDLIDESDKMFNPDKSKVECICPMCGQKHIMNIYWIGRGSPRKYCQNCKGSL